MNPTSAVALRGLLVAGFVLAFFLRSPESFLDPHFYAEEANVYFLFAFENTPFTALTTPHLGYYSLIPNAATAVAAHALPVEYAPFATLSAAFGVILLLASLVLMRGSPFASPWLQAGALGLIVLVPPAYFRVHTTFSQFYLCACSALILVSETGSGPRSWVRIWIRRLALVVGGLTGVVSACLAPVFWLRWWQTRSREVAVQASLLTACAIAQLAVFLTTMTFDSTMGQSRFGGIDAGLLAAVALNQTGIHVFAGTPAFHACGKALAEWAGGEAGGSLPAIGIFLGNLILVLAIVGLRVPQRKSRGTALLLAYAVVLVVSVSAGTTGLAGAAGTGLIAGQARYFYAPNLVFAFALLIHASEAPPMAWLFRAAVVWILAVGTYVQVRHTPPFMLSGPSWRQEVARWRERPRRGVEVWPSGWGKLPLRGDAGEGAGGRRRKRR